MHAMQQHSKKPMTTPQPPPHPPQPPTPQNITTNDVLDEKETLYIQSLSEKEHMAYVIAKNHLKMSFNLKKSIGFQTFSSLNFPS